MIYCSLLQNSDAIFSAIYGLKTFHLFWPKINITVTALANSEMETAIKHREKIWQLRVPGVPLSV